MAPFPYPSDAEITIFLYRNMENENHETGKWSAETRDFTDGEFKEYGDADRKSCVYAYLRIFRN